MAIRALCLAAFALLAAIGAAFAADQPEAVGAKRHRTALNRHFLAGPVVQERHPRLRLEHERRAVGDLGERRRRAGRPAVQSDHESHGLARRRPGRARHEPEGHRDHAAPSRGGKPPAIVYDSITAFLGVYYVTVGIVGFFQREIGPPLRLVMILAGAAALLPDAAIGMIMPGFVSATGVLIGGAVLAIEYVSCRKAAVARDPAGETPCMDCNRQPIGRS